MSHHWAVLRRVGRFPGDLVALGMCTHLCTGETHSSCVTQSTGHAAARMALGYSAEGLHKDMLMKQGCPEVPVLGHSLPVLTPLPVYRSTEVHRDLYCTCVQETH